MLRQFIKGKSRKILLMVFDIVCFFAVMTFYMILIQAFGDPKTYTFSLCIKNALLLIGCMMAFRIAFRVYRNVWRYTNTKSYFQMVLADVLSACFACILSYLIFPQFIGIWFYTDLMAVTSLLCLMARFTYRLIYKHFNRVDTDKESRINVAIIGAGQMGAFLSAELLSNTKSIYKPIFFIDTDMEKVGSHVSGLPVYHADMSIFAKMKECSIKELFIAISRLDSENAERIYEFYSPSNCKLRIYDTPVKDWNSGDDNTEKQRVIREFSIEDLLFRDPLTIGNEKTCAYYKGKIVLVTGGGGSIGSELCRQIAKCQPKKLIILDIYENNAYDIQQELLRTYGDKIDLAVEIASVRNIARLECVFANYKPDVVFHAAAHKHVPLMEHSSAEAIKNNVMGTYHTADLAEKYGVKKFILISTDKAVNPTNVMGASKRLCEMVIQCRRDSKTDFAAVRFGNVLGSNGSVIPLFKKQIADGGPVTVTDKRIIRYFMTIPEASQLVMEAGAMAKKGELFVLDMGKPVRIYDLAVNMIKLSGFEPDVDIEITETGLRPGEKLYEELHIQNESVYKTENPLIFGEKDTPYTREEMEKKLDIVNAAVLEEERHMEIDSGKIKEALKKVIPTFRDPEQVNPDAAKAKEMQLV